MWPFSKKQETTGDTVGFEIGEKQTPFLGKVLLLILTIVLLFFGWRGMEDLKRVPESPERLSNCFVRVRPNTTIQNFPTYFFTYNSQCNFSSYENEAGVPTFFLKAREGYQGIAILDSQIATVQRQLSLQRGRYDTSLRERVAQQQPLYETPEQIRSQILTLESQLQTIKSERARAESEFRTTYLSSLLEAYRQAGESYDREVNWYALQVFFLEILFTLPFFLFALWFYRRLHGKSSPYTVISLPIIIVASMLLAYVILLYFWELFLADLLEFFLVVFANLPILRTLLYYAGMAVAFAIFGGAVFLLQRSIFAPQRVRARRIRHQQCPYCESPLSLGKVFCPGCGKQITAKCSSCGKERYVDIKFCPWCGKEESAPVPSSNGSS